MSEKSLARKRLARRRMEAPPRRFGAAKNAIEATTFTLLGVLAIIISPLIHIFGAWIRVSHWFTKTYVAMRAKRARR